LAHDKYGFKNNTEKKIPSAWDFQLREEVSAESLGVELLIQGYMQAYTDFFYLTTDTTPSDIKLSSQFLEENRLKWRVSVKSKLELTQDSLVMLKESLQEGEASRRDGDGVKCFKTYYAIA